MCIILIVLILSQVYVCQKLYFEHVQLLYIRYLLIKLIHIFKKEKTLTLLHVYVQSVASIGNTLNSVHLAVEAIQKTVDEHKKAMELLQRDLVRKSTSTMESQHSLASSFLSSNSRDTHFPFV